LNKQKADGITYCDYTTNPCKGCKHNCWYCWSRDLNHRFHRSFKPSFDPEELRKLAKVKHKRIFVCDASDMWGDWIPDTWISAILGACCSIPNTYLFLTKNPKRYQRFLIRIPDGSWIGTSITGGGKDSVERLRILQYTLRLPTIRKWLSVEPLYEDFAAKTDFNGMDWVVIGEMTGRFRKKAPCTDEIVELAIVFAKDYNIPIFMKSPLYEKFMKNHPNESHLREVPK